MTNISENQPIKNLEQVQLRLETSKPHSTKERLNLENETVRQIQTIIQNCPTPENFKVAASLLSRFSSQSSSKSEKITEVANKTFKLSGNQEIDLQEINSEAEKILAETIKAQAKMLLEDSSGLIENIGNIAIKDISSLKEAAIAQELKEEVLKLTSLFEKEDINEIKEGFKELCQKREEQNKETALSFPAIPNGDCNKLYYDLCIALFQPASIKELLKIILPGIKQIAIINYAHIPGIQHPEKSVEIRGIKSISLTNTEQTSLDAPLNVLNGLEDLRKFIIANDTLFDVEEITRFPFSWHQELYEKMDNADIKQKLYQHNHELQKLEGEIKLFQKGGLTLEDALNSLIKDLLLSGTRMTGEIFAKNRAENACRDFGNYLNAYPKEVKETLIKVKVKNTNLKNVLNDLDKGKCVELAASHLKMIKEDLEFKSYLKMIPNFDQAKKLSEIKQEYKKRSNQPLNSWGQENTVILPQNLSTPLIGAIKVRNAIDVLDFLISIPPIEYEGFLTKITFADNFEYKDLQEIFDAFAFEQQIAFGITVIKYPDRFPGYNPLESAATNNNPEIIKLLFNSIPENKRAKAVTTQNNRDGQSLLCIAAYTSNPEIIELLLSAIPENERAIELTRIDRNNCSALHMAAANNNPKVIEMILNIISKKERFKVLTTQNKDDISPLHYVEFNKNLEVVKFMLNTISKSDIPALISFAKREDLSKILQIMDTMPLNPW